jgi:16S rRNA (cytosine967-C5)-methyltransferase
MSHEQTSDAASCWRALSTVDPSTTTITAILDSAAASATQVGTALDSEILQAVGLPQSWLNWLAETSMPARRVPDFLRMINSRPPLYLRANYPDLAEEITADLEGAGFKVSVGREASGLVRFAIEGARPIYELKSLKEGKVEIQDWASQRIGEAVAAHPGMAVWDVCAGGGGKSMQIASQLQNRGVLYTSDIREYKLDELKLRARRAGFHNVRRFVYDATKVGSISVGSATKSEDAPGLPREIANAGGFHRVLVDAPCSASGTLRRNPDVRYRINGGDVEKFSELQLQILNSVHGHVRPGGKLIYATCSVFRGENEAVVEKFLSANTAFTQLESCPVGSPDDDSDSMYYCVMQKK